MSGANIDGFELDRQLRVREDQTAEDLASIRRLEEQWDDYRREMRVNSLRYEEAGRAAGAGTALAEREIAARMVLDAVVAQLAFEQEEALSQAAREVRAESDAELERLRRQRAGATWD